MNRRDYLSILATGTAGVTGYATANQQSGSQAGGGTGNATANGTTAAQCEPNTTLNSSTTGDAPEAATGTATSGGLEIVRSEYVEVDGQFGTDAGVWVEVANATETTWSLVEVSAAFRDSDDTVVTQGSDAMFHFPPGDTWQTFLMHTQPESVETATVELTDTLEGQPLQSADDVGITLENVRMVDEGPTVIGTATNTTGNVLSMLEAVVRFRGEEYLYDSGSASVFDLAAGDSWRFEVDAFTLAPDPPAITDYDLGFTT